MVHSMAIHAPGIQRPQPAEDKTRIQVDIIQAPSGGIDARAPVGMMPPNVSVYAYNMMPAEYGMLMRSGFREWIHDLDGGAVLTMMGTLGLSETTEDNRLFGANSAGIYDVGAPNNPTLEVAFADNSDGAGHGVFCHYIDQSGEDFMLFTDSVNGLFEYSGITDAWTASTKITGPVSTDLVFCVVHKQRLWVIEKDKSSAWYLGVAAKDGAATEFYFGSKFPHGGRLAGLFNWSVDGGVGVDDLLVAVSTSGDVVVYQGEDPSAAETWKVRGTYYIGEVPIGRRFASEYAGDLYILSSFGLTAMSDLLRGVDNQNPAENSLAYKVARPLRVAINKDIETYGWEPIFMPTNGSLVVMTPYDLAEPENAIQYVMNLSTSAWGFWRGVPALSMYSFAGFVIVGDQEGNVWIMDGGTDGETIAGGPGSGLPVEFSLVSSTQHFGSPGLNKQVQMVRPDFFAEGIPDFNIKVLYDYDYIEPDYSVPLDWPTDPPITGVNQLVGTTGIGRTVTIAMRGSTETAEARLQSWDVMWTVGGPI